ncbi:hypothetical protein OB945_05710 [Bifidobacterium catenulatum subsp. kashiwanohense]|nr:hypothetical protein [Bifidobacterium catenulatum]MDH7873319.1 hypothetical protein [Bifidobacterium catenulatum subsp. kashiwanohense]
MVVLVDSNRAVKISIREWDEENTQYRPDWSADFFEVGSLQQVPDLSDCTDADLAELGLPPRAVIQLDDVVEPSGRIIDGIGTFISQESFDGICGDQRDRYMAWKNQAEPARLVSAWDDPARLDRLVGDLIDADDGGGCFYTDAQPIDYTQGMDYSPQQLAADSGLGDTVPLACESNASYSLAHHPDIKFTATGSPDGRKALEVSVPGSARHALITAKPGAFDVSLHDERGIVSGESFPYEANDSWTYRLSGQALRGALDLAVGWADPQETSPETAGLDLALDDGMETTHGR